MPIQITARREGFRRCGLAHSEKTKTYPDGHFTPEQLRELEREPQLIVVRIDSSKPTAITNEPRQEDVLADHLELQRRASIIDALSDQLANVLAWSESLQQEPAEGALKDALADYQELQDKLSRSDSLIDALSDQLAIELAWSESLQQELEVLKGPPVPNSDNSSDTTGESGGTDKTTKSTAKPKK